MRLPAALFYALLFVAVLFCLFKIEGNLAGSLDIEQKRLQDAYLMTEKMRGEANLDYQLQAAFNVFREGLVDDLPLLLNMREEPAFLKLLPSHTLSLAVTDASGSLKDFVNLAGSMNEEFARQFIRIDQQTSVEQKEVFLEPEYIGQIEAADRLLTEFLGISTDRTAYMQLRASRMSLFDARGHLLGLYWDSQLLSDGGKAYFFSRFDLSALSDLYPARMYLRSNPHKRAVCAFYDLQRGLFVGNQAFAALPGKTIAGIRDACEEIGRGDDGNVGVLPTGDLLGVVGRRMMNPGMVPVVLLDSEYARPSSTGVTASLIFFSAVCLALFFFVQSICFARGFRMTVGRALLLASLAAISMPFMMGNSIFRLILNEASESGRLKLERNLHGQIRGIDVGARLFHANVLQNFKRQIRSPKTLQQLRQEERHEAKLKAGNVAANAGSASETLNIAGGDLIQKVAVEIFAPFMRGLDLVEDMHRKANAIIIMGPDNFTRYFDRFKSYTYLTRSLPETDPIFLILNLYRRTVEKFFRSDQLAKGLALQPKHGRAGEIELFKFEEIKKHVAASVGNEKVYSMLTNFEGLNSFRTSIGLVNFAIFPVWINNVISYFCGVSWDEFVISRIYLGRVFASYRRGMIDSQKKLVSVFDLIDPVNYVAEPPLKLQAYGNVRGDMLFSGEKASSRLGMLLKTGQRTRRMIKLQTPDSGEALYYVLPGRFFNLYILGGLQSTAHLKQIEDWRALILFMGTILFIVCASLAAVNISRSVSSPLEHLLWGISRIERSDFSVRLLASREDEFGSISRAFNVMARRLRERDTLGKFVSPAVRRLASNPELFQQARAGNEISATILFAALEGFDQFAASAPVQQVQSLLESVLEQFYQQAALSGGEVDKLIGGKLLIVFPHQNAGAHGAAVNAANFVEAILRSFRDNQLIRPVFGLNSGRVISGIIGTPSVRMDNTIIGDPVNVAARLCSLARSADRPVMISETVAASLKLLYPIEKVDIGSIRGKSQEVEVFALKVRAAG
ncbi:MAG TPA: adenylate/guanylate cyclase domain-containing protein [Candidatus Rifleibacterium sp.]|nr:adenylate/guanylate cyclase domain-containing protein [Candidatus Rifleibacterium sp.]